MHGWGGNAAMMLPLARPLHDAGFATLFVDARCHGASDDDSFASLPRFAEDVEHAFEWLAARADIDAGRIALIGHSVGAGAALLAASRRPDVAAVVSVAAFSHPAAMMRRWLATRRIPEWPVGRYILGYVQRTIGHRFDDIAPVTTIARVRCPVLLVHGADDDVVPLDDARPDLRRPHPRGGRAAGPLAAGTIRSPTSSSTWSDWPTSCAPRWCRGRRTARRRNRFLVPERWNRAERHGGPGVGRRGFGFPGSPVPAPAVLSFPAVSGRRADPICKTWAGGVPEPFRPSARAFRGPRARRDTRVRPAPVAHLDRAPAF